MDQRFSVFSLEKYRLELQRGARSFSEDEISSEKVLRPSKLRRLISHILNWIIASAKVAKAEDGISMKPERITNQSYIE